MGHSWFLSSIFALIAALVLSSSGHAALPQLVTAKGNAIPTWTYQTNVPFTTRNGVINVNGTFVNAYVYNPVARAYQWRVVSWTIGNDFTAAQQANIQNNAVATYGVAIGPGGAAAAPTIGKDCHGYSLKSDIAGVYGNNVPTILADQGYKAVAANATQMGDIVVYKKNGSITHTAMVNAVNPVTGAITQVTSRWGSLGIYTGGLNQMPASYGPATLFYSAAAAVPLVDPPSPVDLSEYADLPTENENPQGESEVNGFEGTALNLDSQTGNTWSYTLDAPAEGIFLSPGESLTLFGAGINGASVTGTAASFPWSITTGTDSGTGDSTATFTYEGTTSDLLTNIDGFDITSPYTAQGDLNFEENFNGTVGLSVGPAVPEPTSLALLGTAGGALTLRRRRKS
jgi:hypothetical protein